MPAMGTLRTGKEVVGGGGSAAPATTLANGRRLLDVNEAAAYLGVQPKTIRNWVSAARIPSVKLGRCLRFDVRDLDRLIDQGRRPTPGGIPRVL